MGSGSDNLDYSTFAFDHRITRSIFLSGLVILIYDHLLTLRTEIKYIWSSKLRLSTCWFFTVRYLGLGLTLVMFSYYFGASDHEEEWAWQIFIVSLEVLVEVTLALRVIAMYGFNRMILLGFLAATCTVVGISLWGLIEYGEHPDLIEEPGLSGCHPAFSGAAALRPATIWEIILLFDCVVFVLTVRRAYQRHSLPLYSGSLVQRMVTDGSMYFGIIVLSNLANVLSLYLGDLLLGGLMSWFTTNMSLALICRLMLNLHEAGAHGVASEAPEATLDLHSIRFAMPRSEGADVEYSMDEIVE
ncbi:hypothetical protein FB45DRAFT_1059839 [Roridomyces roridus]|uniref:DUF6533 domain-containing protein n=1 Tax=Roridomyces roridus TaxID=1738132 RepID=A0AAD7FLI6_9AGAR|nr:hypothetical protein FB45DRAFT_1059839 [Roridomyces roridus]